MSPQDRFNFLLLQIVIVIDAGLVNLGNNCIQTLEIFGQGPIYTFKVNKKGKIHFLF